MEYKGVIIDILRRYRDNDWISGSKGGNINVSYRSFLISARNLIRYLSFALNTMLKNTQYFRNRDTN